MRFPPKGSTPYEEALQLGSGSDRFLTAANLLMTWGAQRAAGTEVTDIELGEVPEYTGVHFGEGGLPEVGAAPEDLFSPEGDPYVRPGTTATFVAAGQAPRPIMVISTIVEQKRLGFTWGDREKIGGHGEQLLFVEQRIDGTVWAVIRGFAFLSNGGLLSGLKQRGELKSVTAQVAAFLDALTPGAAIRTGVVTPSSDDESGDAAIEAAVVEETVVEEAAVEEAAVEEAAIQEAVVEDAVVEEAAPAQEKQEN